MTANFNLGQYKTVLYELNQETGYYTKKKEQPLKTPVMRLPYELKLAATRADQIKNKTGNRGQQSFAYFGQYQE